MLFISFIEVDAESKPYPIHGGLDLLVLSKCGARNSTTITFKSSESSRQ